MKFLIQRVTKAQVDIDGQTVGKIDGKGFLVLIGVGEGDIDSVTLHTEVAALKVHIVSDVK